MTIDALTSLDIPFVLVLLTALAAVGTDPQETSPNHQRIHRCSGSEAHRETRSSDTTTPYQETVKPACELSTQTRSSFGAMFADSLTTGVAPAG